MPAARFLAAPACALVLAAAAGPRPVDAQVQSRSVEWTEATTVEVPGAFGAFLRAMPGALETTTTERGIHVDGRRLRRDEGPTSTVVDLEQGRWLTLDHESETYTSFTTEDASAAAQEAAAVVEEAMAGAREGLAEAHAQGAEARAELRRSMAEAREAMDFRIDVRSTGESGSVAGYDAERHLATVEVELDDDVDGVEAGEDGTLVFLVELWQTDDFPDAGAVQEEWAGQLAQDPAFRDAARRIADVARPAADAFGPESLAAWDPRMAAGMEELVASLETLDGTTLRQTVNVAVVPEEAELDEEALLAWEPDSMGDVLRAEAGEAAGDAARNAARDAVGGLTGGLFGGGGDDEEEEEEPPAVRPLIRITHELQDVRDSGAPGAGIYEPPPGYTERPLPSMQELRDRDGGGGPGAER